MITDLFAELHKNKKIDQYENELERYMVIAWTNLPI